MGFWIDENTYQFEDEKEMAASLGIDLETMSGDCAESMQRWRKFWQSAEPDTIYE